MGNGMRPRPLEVIPDDIKSAFEIADIEKVFIELEKHFHISKDWRKFYQDELKRAPRAYDERQVFTKFLMENLDTSLKHITRRQESIILSVMRYVVKDRIDEKRRESKANFNYYSNKKKTP